MATVYTRGGSTTQKKYLRQITEFALPLMMSKRLANTLEITFRIVPDLYSKHDIMGDAWTEDDGRYPKDFVVRLDGKMPLRDFLETAAHELVHVKQWATNQMRDYSSRDKITAYNSKKINTTKVNYWDLPWEVEAHGREVGIFIRWIKHAKLENKAWAKFKFKGKV